MEKFCFLAEHIVEFFEIAMAVAAIGDLLAQEILGVLLAGALLTAQITGERTAGAQHSSHDYECQKQSNELLHMYNSFRIFARLTTGFIILSHLFGKCKDILNLFSANLNRWFLYIRKDLASGPMLCIFKLSPKLQHALVKTTGG